MAEYIEREALLLRLNDIWLTAKPTDAMYDDDRQLAMVRCMGLNDAMDAVKSIPAADVVPMSWVREHMSGDYISREQAVENAIDQMRHSKSETAMRERLLNMVAADVRPVVTCAKCKHNNACLTQAFVEEASRVPFDRNTFFCADGKRADDA